MCLARLRGSMLAHSCPFLRLLPLRTRAVVQRGRRDNIAGDAEAPIADKLKLCCA